MLAIYRIVQEIVRALLDGETVDLMQGRFQHELVQRLVDCQKQHTWAEAATLIEHAVHMAHHVNDSGHADANTVALLANVAGAISNVHGDLMRSERLLREALEIVERSDDAMDDPVYRQTATTTTLAQCLMNQSRFDEAAEAARISWKAWTHSTLRACSTSCWPTSPTCVRPCRRIASPLRDDLVRDS